MAIKVLVAEDYDATRRQICSFLTNEGYDVSEARNGAQALAILQKQEFNLVITNVDMPYLTGFELAEVVQSISPATPVLLVGPYLHTEDTRHHILREPLQVEELASTVRALVGST